MRNEFTESGKWQPKLSAVALEHNLKLRNEVLSEMSLMKRFRKALGFTQIEVAKLLGVTQSNVSKIEIKGDPNLSILARMAEIKGKRIFLVIESDQGGVEGKMEVG